MGKLTNRSASPSESPFQSYGHESEGHESDGHVIVSEEAPSREPLRLSRGEGSQGFSEVSERFLASRLGHLLLVCTFATCAQLLVYRLFPIWVAVGALPLGLLWSLCGLRGKLFSLRISVLIFSALAAASAFARLPRTTALEWLQSNSTEGNREVDQLCEGTTSSFALIRRCGLELSTFGVVQAVRYVGEHRMQVATVELRLDYGRTVRAELSYFDPPWKSEILKPGTRATFEVKVLAIPDIVKFLTRSPAKRSEESAELSEEMKKRNAEVRLLDKRFREGVGAKGIVVAIEPAGYVDSESADTRDRIHSYLFDRFDRRDALALVLTSSLGNEALLSPELLTAFRETGTLHLIVVSGFHLGLVCIGVAKLVSTLWTIRMHRFAHLSADLIGLLVGVIAALYFSTVAEYSLPMLRAIVFLILFTLLRVTHCVATGWELLCWGYLVLLIVEPGAFLSPSLQLTLTALAGLHSAPEILKWARRGWLPGDSLSERVGTHSARRRRYVEHGLVSPVVTAATVFVMTAPIVWFWFQELRPMSIFWNALLGVPFTVIVIFGGLFGILATTVSLRFGELVFFAVLPAVDSILLSVQFLASLSINIVLTPASPMVFRFLFVIFVMSAAVLGYCAMLLSGFGRSAFHSDTGGLRS